MIVKLMVLAAALAAVWAISKLLKRIAEQQSQIKANRAHEAKRLAEEKAAREADIIDLEEDPETGDFKEK